jgi:hypothetical protein
VSKAPYSYIKAINAETRVSKAPYSYIKAVSISRSFSSFCTVVQGIIPSEIVLCLVKDGVDFRNGRLL